MRKFQSVFLMVSTIALTAIPVLGQPSDITPQLARVELLERGRHTERGAWRKLVGHARPEVRIAAMRSIGRVQSMSLLGLIESHLNDGDSTMRREAAFAFGQLPDVGSNALFERLKVEKAPDVRRTLIEAIGKTGRPADGKLLLGLVTPAIGGGEKARVLLSLGRLARKHKGQLGDLKMPWASAFAATDTPPIRYGWSYLLRALKSTLNQAAADALKRCLKDGKSAARVECARALDGLKNLQALRAQASQDKDWRVRVAAARAMISAKDIESVTARLTALVQALSEGAMNPDGSDSHELNVLLAGSLDWPLTTDISAVAKKLHSVASQDPKTTETPFSTGRAHLHCAAATILDRKAKRPKRSRVCGTDAYPLRLREEWLVRTTIDLAPKKRTAKLIRMYRKLGTSGRISVLEALGTIPRSKKGNALILKALMDENAAIVGTAATVSVKTRPETLGEVLVNAYRKAYGAGEFGAVQSIFEAFGAVGLIESQQILERHSNDADPGVKQTARQALKAVDRALRQRQNQQRQIGGLSSGRQARLPPPVGTLDGQNPDRRLVRPPKYGQGIIHTSKGEIHLAFFLKDAQDTVKNFIKLAGRDYFNGHVFHRVVPGFVIQSGDPTGTGWGGPGYGIPCEINPRPFQRGTVGMALSGKDTGGSQFFITHGPAPHLDGRYTAFGKVTKGQEVVDAIGSGDRIIRVELLSAK